MLPAVQPQRHGARNARVLGGNHRLLRHHIEYKIASLKRALGVAQGVVKRRPLDHADEQRLLLQAELLQWRIEIVPRRQREAVNGPGTLLSEIDLVHIAFENLVFRIVQLQQHRHDQFAQFANNSTFGCEGVILDQLLGNRAAACNHLAGAQITQRRTRYTRH